MAAAKYDIVLEEQSDFVLNVGYEDPRGTIVDITGYGAKFEVRDERGASAISRLSATVGEGITLDIPLGMFRIRIISAAIDALADELPDGWRGEWDLLIWPTLASPNINALRLVSGKVKYSRAAAYTIEE